MLTDQKVRCASILENHATRLRQSAFPARLCPPRRRIIRLCERMGVAGRTLCNRAMRVYG
ncbi:MAG: hypothetical protein EOS65_24330 [Mesorhizobium sp.]|nr:hypothetical protein EOA31_08900 [Mesorhizobium sp. M4B.F.Ca.ET.049.02.1.2]RVC62954.1 hypothetical protein EN779_06340 [Mesorhizobium sp. M4B.F.Ca.ET.088.02.2.1]RWA57817.1 MAG: hypothetical protein EOQ27_32450 [Mesorhizobium sp.]RWX67886.1 hypothetical protein EN780_10940 [Mesorhizobium sp. M4B.F.Ca.ET.089.01.1.1]TGV25076.1 hypothetical protein EN786_16720 [Mesorhizobium sp. M4B.F.Ca.ET.143.01.1.1]